MADAAGVALVTGAGQRIGRAIALDLATRGWDVAVHHHRSGEAAEAVAAAIRGLGRRAAVLRADLAQEAEVVALAAAAAEALGPPALLVNNASVFERDEVQDATRESWDRHIETNLRAPLVLAQALARGLPEGQRGNIVNMLDQRVWNLTPHFLSYTVAKAGLWTLTQTLALALAPRIRVNGIGPGPTLPSPRQTEAHFRQQWQAVPLQQPTAVADICRAVGFILDTPSMTGQMIALDGGEHLAWSQARRESPPVE